jgi:uncharacterized protein YcfL
MKHYCLLIVASALLVACEKNTPAETLDAPGTAHTHQKPTNVGSTPFEKPNEEDFFEAPKVP